MDELNLFFQIFQLHHRKGIKSTSKNEYMQSIDIWLSDNNDTSGIFIQIWNNYKTCCTPAALQLFNLPIYIEYIYEYINTRQPVLAKSLSLSMQWFNKKWTILH